MREIGHFIGGKLMKGVSGRRGDVFNPNTGEVQAKVDFASKAEVEKAIANAEAAFPAWAATNPQRRARVMFKFLELIQSEYDDLARLLSSEHGKTFADSKGDIQRGLEVVEFACGIPHLMKGEYTEGAGPGIDLYSVRQPLGVVAGITPFNFPAMIPLWKAAPAIACGNCFVLKPSERDPSVPIRIAELFIKAGLPEGVLNVVNGDKEAVDTLLTNSRVKAIGFVGSSDIAQYIYSTATSRGKRVQCFGGAKNHMIVMPDADIDQAVDALIGAGYGSAGERCMAISVAVPVGKKTADILVEKLIPRVESLKVGPSTDLQADYGPMVTRAHLNKVKDYVATGIKEGAKLKVDGREFKLQGYENGNFMGGCLFDDVTPDMKIYKEEIFGPVLSVVRAKDYEEAVRLPSDHEYGNGVSIFTRDGDTARDFTNRVQVGMVGVNFAIPVPLAYHTFGGWKRSGFGDLNQHGPDSIRFYTKTKTVTARWPSGTKEGAEFVIPNHEMTQRMAWLQNALQGSILAILAIGMAGCRTDGFPSLPGAGTTGPGAEALPAQPPVNMAGRWVLAQPGRGQCNMTFRAASPTEPDGTIAPEGGCPGKFFTSRKWAFDSNGLSIRDHNSQPLAQLSAAAGGRFDGKATTGDPVTLTR